MFYDHKIPWLLFLFVTAVMDFKERKFKNIIFLLIMAFGVLFYFFDDYEYKFFNPFLSSALLFFIFLPLYFLGVMAAGDVKFAAVLGFWVDDPEALIFVFVLSNLLAAFHSVLLLNNSHSRSDLNFAFLKSKRSNFRSKSIPYAGYMAASMILWMSCNFFK